MIATGDVGTRRRLRAHRIRGLAVLGVATALVLWAAWVSVVTGIAGFSSAELLATLLPPGWVSAQPLDRGEWTIFLGIRLLRVTAAVIAGIGLALCGAVMQIVTRNPMASPFTTGISNAAAFGAGLAIFFGASVAGSTRLAITMCAFASAAACSLIVVGISARAKNGAAALILAGIALSYLFSALSAGLQYVAHENQLAPILHWTFGDLGRATWGQLAYLGGIVGVGAVYVLASAGRFAKLAMGDDAAVAMGIPVRRIRVESGLLVTAVSASIISVTGVIGFVGLVAPHLATMLIGPREQLRLPMTALLGALLLLLADLAGRNVVSPVVVPVGIMVSLVGVPLFLWLIIRENHRGRR